MLLKKISILFVVLLLSTMGYDFCRIAGAAERSVMIEVPGCDA